MATETERATAAPGVAPARLTAREIDRDEMALTFGHDEELRQTGRVHDGAGRWAAQPGADPRAERDFACPEVVHLEVPVGQKSRDAARRDDRCSAHRRHAPNHLARSAVEAERFEQRT